MVRHDTGVGGGDGVGGDWCSPHCCRMWQNAKWNSLPPQSRIGPEKEHVRGTMACPSRSRQVWVTAAMFIGRLRWQSGGGGGLVLFRQELGMSSDSKILLIYDVSTPIFSPTPLTPADKRPAGKRWHSVKLLVCLPLTFNAEDRVQARRLGAPPPFDLRVSDPNLVPWSILLIRLMKPYLKVHVHFLDLCCVVVGAFTCLSAQSGTGNQEEYGPVNQCRSTDVKSELASRFLHQTNYFLHITFYLPINCVQLSSVIL